LLAEQKKIAFVLNEYDNKIKFLKKKLTALQNQKKGLMQQLLTGKVRVKIESVV
jgi:type I restriction enzyme, S subunit